MKLVWFPTWRCNNYADKSRCPYCPYNFDHEEGRLTYQGELSGKEGRIPPEVIKDLCRNNFAYLGGKIEISGGEPLAYKGLSEALDSRIRWAITSNTSIRGGVKELIESGAMKRCFSWTASYHPLSRRVSAFADNIEDIKRQGVNVAITVVVSEETLPTLERTKRFVDSLPANGVNYHMETHKDVPDSLATEAIKILGEVPFIAGKPKQGTLCHKGSRLCALAPDGSIYECVTHCYTGKKKVGKVKIGTDLEKVLEKGKDEWCDDECFACCDWVKHYTLVDRV